jgi:hypothetical protein
MGKSRAGRKRKAGKREGSGKLQRPTAGQVKDNAMQTAVAYRQSVFGISPADAKDQKAATLLGRLCIQGTVSEAQWQAGEDYLRLVNQRHAAVSAPRGFRTAGNAALATDEDAETRRYWDVKARFDAANDAVEGHAPVIERVARMKALSIIVVQEVDQPGMHGTLRTALNGLVKHFKTEAKGA